MTSYQFTGAYTTFYPDERNAEGKSLMAEPGMVVEFGHLPPSDGKWIPVEPVVEAAPEVPPVVPEPAPVALAPLPGPPVTPVVPEPLPVVVEPQPPMPAPAPFPEPQPVPVPDPLPPADPQSFRVGYVSPYARV